MGRKKNESNIVNIGELTVENKIEIDYDKLAEAIVKAQEKKEKIDRENFKNAKTSGFTKCISIGCIVVAVFLILISIPYFVEKEIISGLKIILMSALFVVLRFAVIITAKTTDKNYSINVAMVTLALAAVILDVIQK